MTNTITLYESRLCGFCSAARRMLDGKGWKYDSIVVDGKPDLFDEMQERSGRHTVPQIFFGGHHVGGFDDMAELEADGELEQLYTDKVVNASGG